MDEKQNITRSFSTVAGIQIKDVSNFGTHGIGTIVYQNSFYIFRLLFLNKYDLNLTSKYWQCVISEMNLRQVDAQRHRLARNVLHRGLEKGLEKAGLSHKLRFD